MVLLLSAFCRVDTSLPWHVLQSGRGICCGLVWSGPVRAWFGLIRCEAAKQCWQCTPSANWWPSSARSHWGLHPELQPHLPWVTFPQGWPPRGTMLTGGINNDLRPIPGFTMNVVCSLFAADIFHHQRTCAVTYFECIIWNQPVFSSLVIFFSLWAIRGILSLDF